MSKPGCLGWNVPERAGLCDPCECLGPRCSLSLLDPRLTLSLRRLLGRPGLPPGKPAWPSGPLPGGRRAWNVPCGRLRSSSAWPPARRRSPVSSPPRACPAESGSRGAPALMPRGGALVPGWDQAFPWVGAELVTEPWRGAQREVCSLEQPGTQRESCCFLQLYSCRLFVYWPGSALVSLAGLGSSWLQFTELSSCLLRPPCLALFFLIAMCVSICGCVPGKAGKSESPERELQAAVCCPLWGWELVSSAGQRVLLRPRTCSEESFSRVETRAGRTGTERDRDTPSGFHSYSIVVPGKKND